MRARIAAVILVLCAPALMSFASWQPPASTLQDQNADHVAWVMRSLERMESIKPGMTRGDLMRLFTTEGGLQTGKSFVFRECPYFKVTVEWMPGGAADPAIGKPSDVIKSISRPYIQRMIID